ncbi:MAG: hypothetical protein RDU30_11425 [Desulfovibrionaceae bacterium]|nr:hypothetical protein [Desulfovibrionaceae bacterium]
MKKWHFLPGLVGILFCLFALFGETGRAFGNDGFFVIPVSSSSSDLTQLKADVKTLQSQVAALSGRIFPYGLVNMYEDSNVKIELTGQSKTVTDIGNRYTTVAFRLLITNKTTNTMYIGEEIWSSSVFDEHGRGEVEKSLKGISTVYSNASNRDYFSAISPNSTLTANWTSPGMSATFYDSHYLTASFSFVLFGTSGNTRFNAGFTGIYLP